MQTAYIVTGTLNDDRTVILDEALPLEPMKVRLAIEPLAPILPRAPDEVIAEICERQQRRGYQPPTRAEVDAHFNFKTPDSIQLAAALVANSGVFLTNDHRFSRFTAVAMEVI
jgi:hypothetical protein